jgi:transposase-like protein
MCAAEGKGAMLRLNREAVKQQFVGERTNCDQYARSIVARHASIISHAVWLYYRFTLSFRDVEDLLA